jgi:hydroxypyruvate reductase
MVSIAPAIASARRWHVVAAGKAAGPMLGACVDATAREPATAMAVAPGGLGDLRRMIETFAGGHPVPNAASCAAGRRALDMAADADVEDVLIVLVSGGASALLVSPVDGVTLADKQATTQRLLKAGADIYALNAVRKHLSLVKGGRLAAACPGRVLALAISDVVGDDISVIGSGIAAGDTTTFADALAQLDRCGGRRAYPPSVVHALREGAAGRRAESPRPGAPALGRSETRMIGSRREAMAGARDEAVRLGYRVVVMDEPVVGEARVAARRYAAAMQTIAATGGLPVCVVSSGETTVHVNGRGRGGRNQEFALALTPVLPEIDGTVVVASVGTDGVDGPTDAAGAVVTSQTRARAVSAQIDPDACLDDNDAYRFFDALGDLIRIGPTRTNVGDLQIALIAAGEGYSRT